VKQVIEVCILAGGLSSRMGRDKAGIALNGKKLLARVKMEAEKTGWKVRVVRKDVVERCGPLGGVYTALKTSKKDAVLFVACDMPFVSAELLQRVAGAMTGKVDAVFTKQKDFVTFPFALRTSALEVVDEQIRSGDLSLQNLARTLKVRLVRAKASEVFDIDTLEDLAKARTLTSKTFRRAAG
jgi:molybdopterin-guanine dinucleotide biosynthesis protein A